MASTTDLSNVVVEKLGIVETALVTTASNQKAAGVGLSLANLTGTLVTASMFVEDGSGNKAHYFKDLKIGPKATARVINGGEKLLLGPNNTLSIVTDINDSIDVVFSVVIITYT